MNRVRRPEKQRLGGVQPLLGGDGRDAEAFARAVFTDDSAQDLDRPGVLQDVAVAQMIPRGVGAWSELDELAGFPGTSDAPVGAGSADSGPHGLKAFQTCSMCSTRSNGSAVRTLAAASSFVTALPARLGTVHDALDELLDHDAALPPGSLLSVGRRSGRSDEWSVRLLNL